MKLVGQILDLDAIYRVGDVGVDWFEKRSPNDKLKESLKKLITSKLELTNKNLLIFFSKEIKDKYRYGVAPRPLALKDLPHIGGGADGTRSKVNISAEEHEANLALANARRARGRGRGRGNSDDEGNDYGGGEAVHPPPPGRGWKFAMLTALAVAAIPAGIVGRMGYSQARKRLLEQEEANANEMVISNYRDTEIQPSNYPMSPLFSTDFDQTQLSIPNRALNGPIASRRDFLTINPTFALTDPDPDNFLPALSSQTPARWTGATDLALPGSDADDETDEERLVVLRKLVDNRSRDVKELFVSLYKKVISGGVVGYTIDSIESRAGELIDQVADIMVDILPKIDRVPDAIAELLIQGGEIVSDKAKSTGLFSFGPSDGIKIVLNEFLCVKCEAYLDVFEKLQNEINDLKQNSAEDFFTGTNSGATIIKRLDETLARLRILEKKNAKDLESAKRWNYDFLNERCDDGMKDHVSAIEKIGESIKRFSDEILKEKGELMDGRWPPYEQFTALLVASIFSIRYMIKLVWEKQARALEEQLLQLSLKKALLAHFVKTGMRKAKATRDKKEARRLRREEKARLLRERREKQRKRKEEEEKARLLKEKEKERLRKENERLASLYVLDFRSVYMILGERIEKWMLIDKREMKDFIENEFGFNYRTYTLYNRGLMLQKLQDRFNSLYTNEAIPQCRSLKRDLQIRNEILLRASSYYHGDHAECDKKKLDHIRNPRFQSLAKSEYLSLMESIEGLDTQIKAIIASIEPIQNVYDQGSIETRLDILKKVTISDSKLGNSFLNENDWKVIVGLSPDFTVALKDLAKCKTGIESTRSKIAAALKELTDQYKEIQRLENARVAFSSISEYLLNEFISDYNFCIRTILWGRNVGIRLELDFTKD